MKILVLGGAGMLGHKVVQQLSASHSLSWTLHGGLDDAAFAGLPMLGGPGALPHVDVRDFDALRGQLRDLRPDVVVNCVGWIKQLGEQDSESAMIVNGAMPHQLADASRALGARLIHISTDCVFSGDRGNYTESDLPDAIDLYGRSKAAGEVRADHVLTLRTSMIGRELRRHRSLLDWFLSQRNNRIRGYRRAIWSGVTTLHLARLIAWVLEEHPQVAGLYHVSSGRTSKLDLLRLLKKSYHLEVEIEADDSLVCDRSLVGTRFEQATGYRCPPLSEMIDELVADPTPYPKLS